jgi:hypothetical protein
MHPELLALDKDYSAIAFAFAFQQKLSMPNHFRGSSTTEHVS